jgi:hypothetical protein
VKRRKRNSINEQFSARVVSMLESPAYRVLSLSARRILDRLEIELAHHGGNDNGDLVVTRDQFIAFGPTRTRHPPGPPRDRGTRIRSHRAGSRRRRRRIPNAESVFPDLRLYQRRSPATAQLAAHQDLRGGEGNCQASARKQKRACSGLREIQKPESETDSETGVANRLRKRKIPGNRLCSVCKNRLHYL